MKHLAEACAGDLDHQRGRAWPALIRQRPLGMAERGAAPHAEPAVEPRLAGQPLQRLDAILALMTQRIERAARFEAPARSLHHNDVTPARPDRPTASAERLFRKVRLNRMRTRIVGAAPFIFGRWMSATRVTASDVVMVTLRSMATA